MDEGEAEEEAHAVHKPERMYTISRGWREEYSWSKRGLNQERQNTIISESLKVIFSKASSGWWFALLTQSNINAK